MSLRRSMEQLRPARTQKIDLLEKSQILLQEAKGLDIGELQKVRGGKPRFYTLVDVINKGTKVDTTQGKTSLKWANKSDRLSFEGGDMISAFTDGRRYKPVFVTSKGKEIKLNDILKTDIFGGGKGSGGGAENTATTECAQCIYAAAIFGGEKLKVGDVLDESLYGNYSNKFEIDIALDKIATDMTDDWAESSILIANQMKKDLKGKGYTFHRGSPFVDEIENKFKELNKLQKPKPFSNVNKWSPADIYAVKDGATFDFSQYSNLGEFTNELKEFYDKKTLVGISLKKVSGRVTVVEKNTTGFIRRPVKYGGFKTPKNNNFFSAKDMYIYLGQDKTLMQLRTFDTAKGWQGEIKGKGAAAGKIGGGVLESIAIKNSTLTKFPYTNAQLLSVSRKPTPAFLNELYELHLTLGGDEDKNNFIKKAKANKIGKTLGYDWRFSKYLSMFFIAHLESSKSSAHKICDNIAAYSMSESNDSAPHVVYKS